MVTKTLKLKTEYCTPLCEVLYGMCDGVIAGSIKTFNDGSISNEEWSDLGSY